VNPREIWERLAASRYGMAHGTESAHDFDRWACASPELERVIGPDRYLKLISIDNRHKDADLQLNRVIDGIYADLQPGLFLRDVAAWTARTFLSGQIGLAKACGILTELWHTEEGWVPTEFVYIDSEMDEMPEGDRLAEFERAAREAARELLTTLEASS
jgi:hypothetical protein